MEDIGDHLVCMTRGSARIVRAAEEAKGNT